ncbi:uncharacterized protein O3C94_008410 [Discoglossus pictus]
MVEGGAFPVLQDENFVNMMDDDVTSDRVSGSRKRYEDEEDYHSIYIGVPAPRSYRRKRRRRRSLSSRERSSENEKHYSRDEHSDTDEGGQVNYDNEDFTINRTYQRDSEYRGREILKLWTIGGPDRTKFSIIGKMDY